MNTHPLYPIVKWRPLAHAEPTSLSIVVGSSSGYTGGMERLSPIAELLVVPEEQSRPAPPALAVGSRTHSWLHRLFRPRFSLRTLLIGMAIVGAGLGMFRRLDNQRQLVARIEAAGGLCRFSSRGPSGYIGDWFRSRLPRSFTYDVSHVIVHSNGEELNRILWHLSGLQTLEIVDLDFTNVSDVSLRHLANLESLRHLYLNQTDVSDAGLHHLAELRSLKILGLSGTKITDAGIAQLAEMKSLEQLDLINTQVSKGGIQQLKTALPNCKIVGPWK